MAESGPISAPLVVWAAELGVDDKTLRERLVAAGVGAKRRESIRAREVFGALTSRGDLDEQRIRDVRASADLKEMKRKMLEGTLVLAADVESSVQQAVIAARAIIWQSSMSESEKRRTLKALSEMDLSSVNGAASAHAKAKATELDGDDDDN